MRDAQQREGFDQTSPAAITIAPTGLPPPTAIYQMQ